MKNEETIWRLFAFGIFAMMAVAVLSGCHSTSKITEFDANGKITKVTETNESALNAVVESASKKSIVISEEGWIAVASVSPGTQDDPTPHFKFKAADQHMFYLSILPGQQDLKGMAEIIKAIRSGKLAVGTEGIEAQK